MATSASDPRRASGAADIDNRGIIQSGSIAPHITPLRLLDVVAAGIVRWQHGAKHVHVWVILPRAAVVGDLDRAHGAAHRALIPLCLAQSVPALGDRV